MKLDARCWFQNLDRDHDHDRDLSPPSPSSVLIRGLFSLPFHSKFPNPNSHPWVHFFPSSVISVTSVVNPSCFILSDDPGYVDLSSYSV